MPSERIVPIRDGAVKFRVLSGGRGPALLYLHSFHDRNGWPPLLERLAERFTVHAPFHPGVQGSDGVEAIDDVVDLALAYDELLGAVGVDALFLMGHFFGGMAAAELAAICPGRARRLCLISPLGLWIDGKAVADVVILPPADLDALLWSSCRNPTRRTSPPRSSRSSGWRRWASSSGPFPTRVSRSGCTGSRHRLSSSGVMTTA